MSIKIVPTEISGYDDETNDHLFTVAEEDEETVRVTLQCAYHSLQSWRDMSAAIERAIMMMTEGEK